MLMPVLNNIGNVLYVFVAIMGGVFLLNNAPNVRHLRPCVQHQHRRSVPQLTKQFTGNISQVSNQLNSVIMGLAGTQRIFNLLDEEPEVDEGYVTLVNAKEKADGSLEECEERTNVWAWKHPHNDGTVTYTRLAGDVRMYDVDFGYTPEKTVLHGVSLYAKPGQKVAFVGSTGAGKTTITNLINRFYDIADGKIRYDGININRSRRQTCAARSAWFCRTPTCSPARSWRTSATAVSTRRTRSAWRRLNWPARTTSSPVCRRATTRRFPETARASRRASASCSRSPARPSPTRPS